MNLRQVLASVATAAVLAAVEARAGDLLPHGFDGTVRITRLDALVLHAGDREELVLGHEWRIEAGLGPLPAFLGWVIPIPAPAHAVAREKPWLFVELHETIGFLEERQVFEVDLREGRVVGHRRPV